MGRSVQAGWNADAVENSTTADVFHAHVEFTGLETGKLYTCIDRACSMQAFPAGGRQNSTRVELQTAIVEFSVDSDAVVSHARSIAGCVHGKPGKALVVCFFVVMSSSF